MVLWRCLSRHNRPPTKNVRPSKTEKERGRRWRMVHSGPFNGLCEIESSRGSPGISNIFLPMLELLRTTFPLSPPPSLPFSSRRTSYRRLLHISPSLLRYYPTKAAHPHRSSSSRSSAAISQLPAEASQRM